MSLVEREYRKRIDAMSIAQKVERSFAMLRLVRETIAREFLAEAPSTSPERLKWLVALRLYGSEPRVRRLIEEMLARVPD